MTKQELDKIKFGWIAEKPERISALLDENEKLKQGLREFHNFLGRMESISSEFETTFKESFWEILA